jgi:hypothetical protein
MPIKRRINMQPTQYSSRDFYLSAYLLAMGNSLEMHKKDAGGKTLFVFESTPELNQQIHRFYALEAQICPVQYGNALRNLKSIIHADENTDENKQYVRYIRNTR